MSDWICHAKFNEINTWLRFVYIFSLACFDIIPLHELYGHLIYTVLISKDAMYLQTVKIF